MTSILEHTHNGQRWLFVPTPPHYQSHVIYMGYIILKVWNEKNGWDSRDAMRPDKIEKYLKNHDPSKDYKDIPFKLPDGDWSGIAKLSDIADEQAREMVPFIVETEYPEYAAPFEFEVFYDGTDTALEGIHSLIRSLGGDPQNNEYLLLKEG